jgi:hypothetical protein
MSSQQTQDIVIRAATPDELFNAPAIDPFSGRDIELRGQSGLEYLVRQLQARRRDWKNARVLVRLPREHSTPDMQTRLPEALRRYCRAKITDNAFDIHLIRVRSSVGLGILAAIVVVLIALASVLFETVLASAPQVLWAVIALTISLFGWVSLWGPLEALIFNPIPMLRENFVLRKIIEMPIVVEPERESSVSGDAHVPDADIPCAATT